MSVEMKMSRDKSVIPKDGTGISSSGDEVEVDVLSCNWSLRCLLATEDCKSLT